MVALYENNQSTFVDFDLRKDSLDSLGFVDKVIGISINELENTIENLQPDIVVKGKRAPDRNQYRNGYSRKL